ncbi:MAG: sigma-70 family RNA polymerase sigma factor [Opitutaceae bacterium]|nr:sigma-70 family RNA polymerase sigma factor [Opitutaceae bacterium]
MLLATARPPFVLGVAPRRTPGPRTRMTGPAVNSNPGDDRDREFAALMAGMARGDKGSLARLYDLLAKPLYGLALRIVNDPAEAQDVVQDVFLQLWQKASAFDTARGSVFSWAATLARNRSIDRVRMRRRRAELLAGAAPELQPASAGTDDSAGSLWLREKAAAVRQALTRLAPDQQAAIELAFFGGLTQQEIAAKLNEPLGTVKARIRRGLLRLRESLPDRL